MESAEDKKLRLREAHRRWYEQNRERIRKERRQVKRSLMLAKQQTETPPVRACRYCGKDLGTSEFHYCSRECYRKDFSRAYR